MACGWACARALHEHAAALHYLLYFQHLNVYEFTNAIIYTFTVVCGFINYFKARESDLLTDVIHVLSSLARRF